MMFAQDEDVTGQQPACMKQFVFDTYTSQRTIHARRGAIKDDFLISLRLYSS